ncbi:MAG: hypothetical protein ACRDTH_16230 [Pseudonocardiaceae bacterium]
MAAQRGQTAGGGSDHDHVEATAAHLVGLLTSHAPYRRRWQEHSKAHQHRGSEIHQGVVCQVIAEHLWDCGEMPDDDHDLPRRLKDTVSRALSGRILSPRTLTWFINAFAMSDMHASELWALRSGGDPARLSVVRATEDLPERPISSVRYQTIALHEFHTVGADGIPVQHRTVHLIRALEVLQCYSYRFDTDAAVVEVVRGGVAGPVYRTAERGIHAVDITLNRLLSPGDTASFEYRTVLRYKTPPPQEFRRATRRRVENVELNVQFAPSLLPTAIWWAIWDDLDDPRPSFEQQVPLEPDGSVHTYLDVLEGIVGYHWDFPPH